MHNDGLTIFRQLAFENNVTLSVPQANTHPSYENGKQLRTVMQGRVHVRMAVPELTSYIHDGRENTKLDVPALIPLQKTTTHKKAYNNYFLWRASGDLFQRQLSVFSDSIYEMHRGREREREEGGWGREGGKGEEWKGSKGGDGGGGRERGGRAHQHRKQKGQAKKEWCKWQARTEAMAGNPFPAAECSISLLLNHDKETSVQPQGCFLTD